MERAIAIIGTFDSKGPEYAFIKDRIEAQGLRCFMIHAGVFEPALQVDVSNEEVAASVGASIEEIAARKDRAYAMQTLSKGVEKILPVLYSQKKFDGVISLGGTGGTSLVAPGMRALPVGVPKIIVSTIASGDVSAVVGESDLILMPSIVDVAGINSISKRIFTNAANAITGMVQNLQQESVDKKKVVAATMFGVTTPCINAARKYLEERGYEVLVFHATGAGGRTMEKLIESGVFDGVLDITTTEWCDQLVGGVLAAGPRRLEAAGRCSIPQVVSVGALDMVNFGPPETVPEKFSGRKFYQHNPMTTLMRTTVEECTQLGQILAEKLNKAKDNTVLMLPLKGVSLIDVEGGAFYGKQEDEALFEELRKNIDKSKVKLLEYDCDINDPMFAEEAARHLVQMMEKNN